MNPLNAIYGVAAGVRNRLYDRGMLKARRLSAPIVSVGNISVGGTGKTPFVILLGEFLRQRRVPFDVLSRGYGRRTKGPLAVDPESGSAQDYGDEPVLIAYSTGGPVFVGESRYQAGLLAEKSFAAKLHILDDGFQHRSLARDLDIVMVTPEDLHDRLLPGGRLREPLSSLHRADVVVVQEQMQFDVSFAGKPIWRVRRRLNLTQPPQNPVVFCGIGRPDKFVSQVQAEGITPAAVKTYRDHWHYSKADVEELLKLRDHKKAGGFITTEKDGVNLGILLAELGDISIAQLKMEIIDPPDALNTLLHLIEAAAPEKHERISDR